MTINFLILVIIFIIILVMYLLLNSLVTGQKLLKQYIDARCDHIELKTGLTSVQRKEPL